MLDQFISDNPLPQDPLWLPDRADWREELLIPCLEEFTSPGDLVLDGIARHATLLRAAQTSGRRVLISNADPLPLLQLQLALSPPEPRLLDRVVSRLADTAKAGKTLSRHLDDLYLVICPDCERASPAEFIVWEGKNPLEKGFRCGHCGEAGIEPITVQDLDIQAAVEAEGASYWRLHGRLATPGDTEPIKARVQRLLNLYTARNRYALTELILQAEVLFPGDEAALNIVRGLCLACLQRCHSLDRSPERSNLPRSLRRPRHFVERNVWQTFEAAYRKLRIMPRTSAISWAVDLPALLETVPGSQGGTALALPLSTREVSAALKGYPPLSFICSDPPRPDPAPHALAFLWTGWLFGREATLPLRSLATRLRSDWEWYTQAMSGVFRLLQGVLADGGRLLLAFDSPDKELLPALLLAASRTELELDQAIHQVQGDPGCAADTSTTHRLLFRRRHRPLHPLPAPEVEPEQEEQELALELHGVGLKTIEQALEVRGEPAAAAWLQPSVCKQWSRSGLLGDVPRRQSLQPLTWLLQQMEALLPAEGPAPEGLLRLQPTGKVRGEEEGGGTPACWWLADPPQTTRPLSEMVEQVTARLLQETLAWPRQPLHDKICQQFGGLRTPEVALLDACISSYGQELSPGYWRLRAEDWPQPRAEAHRKTLALLTELGKWLGLATWLAPEELARLETTLSPGRQGAESPHTTRPDWAPCTVVWHDEGAPVQGFALSDNAGLSDWLAPPTAALAGVPRCVVVPGGRSILVAFKLRCCPEYRQRLADHGWTIIKQRHLRRLADMEDLDLTGWWARLGLDPIAEQGEQQLVLF